MNSAKGTNEHVPIYFAVVRVAQHNCGGAAEMPLRELQTRTAALQNSINRANFAPSCASVIVKSV